MQYSLLKGHFTHVKLFFKITEIETLINITYHALPDFFSQQMFLCFIINSFNDKTIIAMCAAILPNLLRFLVEEAGCDVSGVEVSKTFC